MEALVKILICILYYQGISFKDFKEFGMFLNNLDDFAMAIRMYTYANQPVSEGKFPCI